MWKWKIDYSPDEKNLGFFVRCVSHSLSDIIQTDSFSQYLSFDKYSLVIF